ncbi:MAG: hypothetical protein ACPGYV_15460, partial [Phycisphaeraceae bacterium]
MRLLLLAAVVPLVGCERPIVERPIQSPYAERQVWAVAPLRNESGSRHANGLKLADDLTRAFEQVVGIDALPVNRVLEAMQALQLERIASREDAIHLRETLGVDALVVGSVTHYDAYDPPKLGLALDLYTWPVEGQAKRLDIRGLSWAPTADKAGIRRGTLYRPDQPVTTVSGYFDASGIGTKRLIDDYAYGRGTTPNALHERRLYTINMNLFQEFASHEVGSQLIWAEWRRLA